MTRIRSGGRFCKTKLGYSSHAFCCNGQVIATLLKRNATWDEVSLFVAFKFLKKPLPHSLDLGLFSACCCFHLPKTLTRFASRVCPATPPCRESCALPRMPRS